MSYTPVISLSKGRTVQRGKVIILYSPLLRQEGSIKPCPIDSVPAQGV